MSAHGADAGARANAAQAQASDPAVSAFVAASAGSGKTKLLTDRLLRLMLAGADPARILCLTYTKAAAAEMALRLQRRLGEWAIASDAGLDAALTGLGIAPDPGRRRLARGLFARVLDLPDGMRIGTIHAFCQSLLRRFPLEAGLVPHFRLLEEHEARTTLADARETRLAQAHADTADRAALERLAGCFAIKQFDGLLGGLAADQGRLAAALEGGLEGARGRIKAALGAPGGRAAAEDARRIAGADAALGPALAIIAAKGPTGAAARAAMLADLLANARHADGPNPGLWDSWYRGFLSRKGEPLAQRTMIGEKLAKAQPDLEAPIAAECVRILEIEERIRAADAAEASLALLRLAAPAVAAYGARKAGEAALDYDDLILRTRALLADPGAAWVLYKLDGGIDHLLLDEVQDTAPAQWRIAEALTGDFFAGLGATQPADGAPARSIFAVGDRKQSIYSFQGADAAEFDTAQERLAQRVRQGGGVWRPVGLDVSFRSTAPVLDLVDAVFADPETARGVTEPGTLHHLTVRAGQAGRVELWPLIRPAPSQEEDGIDGTPAQTNQTVPSAPRLLAQRLAAWIARETDGNTMLASRGRVLAPGDVLILLRQRGVLAQLLVRALKERGVPVAGLDRMTLDRHPAVQDVLSLAEALLLPEDDLALACFLTSPLGGLDDAGLMALAMERRGSLMGALLRRAEERADWQAAAETIRALGRRIDYAPPSAILAEALGPLGGRARLLARFGPEAAEPLDELLAVARGFEAAHPPAMQSFVHWLRRAGMVVNREAEAAGAEVRIMTVHGAKGLQAPLVILPDTVGKTRAPGSLLWAEAGPPQRGQPVPLLVPVKDARPASLTRLLDARQVRQREEENRLLYVALTRAEDRLVVCGALPEGREPGEHAWYAQVARGFTALAPSPLVQEDGASALVHECAAIALPDRVEPGATRAEPPPELPAWLGRAPDWRAVPVAAEAALAEPLAPSRPDWAEAGPEPQAASPLAGDGGDPAMRFRRGALLHALLQHLPDLPRATRREAAIAFLARPGHALGDQALILAEECLAILDHPDLGSLFGPGSRAEVPISGVAGGRVVGGMIDRLAVLDGAVLIADFKTNRSPPADPTAIPVLYLRQMAAYRAVLRQVFPAHTVHCALIWTRGARVDILDEAALDRHDPGNGHDPSHAVPAD